MLPLWSDFSYFEHQVTGIKWMLEKEINGTLVSNATYTEMQMIYGGFQCDDMGLGKTIQLISTMVNNPQATTLIIAPLAMIETWSSVCSRAGLRVFELQHHEWNHMNPGTSIPSHFRRMRPSVYITNYDKLIHNPSLCKKEWDRIILDEAHVIRNGSGEAARAVRSLTAPIRWVVTGTPLVNSLKDIVSLLAFLGVPHSRHFSWTPHYMTILPDLLLHRSLDSLRAIIKGAPPVPEIIEEVLPFFTPEEEDFYKGVQCIDPDLSMGYIQDIMSSVQTFQLFLRLRQLSVHPQIYINAKRRQDSTYIREDWTLPTTKFEYIKNSILDDDDGRVHKYIIFCQFMEEMDLLSEQLSYLVPEILVYHGGLSQKQRTDVLAYSKQTTDTTVLLLQLQAGGVGLNLQEYDRIIFVSPWWTSALMDQAVARAVRMGQSNIVKVYHLSLCIESEYSAMINIDETMKKKAEEKRQMLQNIFNQCTLESDDDAS